MCITLARGSRMHINYHARSVTRANLTRATLASSLDASKSDASNPVNSKYTWKDNLAAIFEAKLKAAIDNRGVKK